MNAYLDHIGIAVSDLSASLGFFRDGLGLDVQGSEDVTSQRVRAHFVHAGHSSLELLEATAPDSPIARYLAKRGPGLHHITLRVDDIRAALTRAKERNIRLIDDQPRPGAEGALVAFIHPASAHGVLVELKQAASKVPPLAVSRYTVGNFELISLYDGTFRLDGGAMFGVVPKALWEKKTTPDDSNRIPMTMRPLVVRDGTRTMLIDAGLGDKESEKFYRMYAVDRTHSLDQALAEAGIAADEIDIVLASHLHFDHAGGFTARNSDGVVVPRFPNARYVVRRGEWNDARKPHERNRASYLPDNFMPLADAGVLDFIEEDCVVMPGVKVQRTGGHTAHHQIIWVESGRDRAVFLADMMPTSAHLPDPWIMGYDLYPMDTLFAKQAFAREVARRETLVFFEHDPAIPAAFITEQQGKLGLRPRT
ncbi:MAG TPA: methylmalonyl-CoA epimerase [Vicinamibacterales bacterium]|nr:methylmalonyl-CoA epimerase [Vicinamibacterales bacterium]